MERRTWSTDWEDRVRGEGCPLCGEDLPEVGDWGARFLTGKYCRVVLQRKTPLPGYSVAVWNRGHVVEPTDLSSEEAVGYWLEVLIAGRAIKERFRPAKLNLLTLGNGAPHLHTHILPRYLDDPAPHRPLPWDLIDNAPALSDADLLRDATALHELVAPHIGRG